MKPVDFRARVSAKSANENAQIEDLNLQAHENVTPQKRSAKIHDFCLGIPFGKRNFHQFKTLRCSWMDLYCAQEYSYPVK